METLKTNQMNWNLIQKIVFRFFFIYIILYTAPWTWLDNFSFIKAVTQYYHQLIDWLMNAANSSIFKTYKQLVPPLYGSGDTSWAWIQLWVFGLVSMVGSVIWTAIAIKKEVTKKQFYFLITVLRYFLAIHSFGYGIVKLFALQMSFPNLSQLATPLGDFLPMRLSWIFIGYSEPYQMFSGAMEVVAGSLLFFRRTTTAGVLLACGVFVQVMMLNYCYDIPVKIFSTHLVAMSLFLIAMDSNRILAFFVLNKTAAATVLYEPIFNRKWHRISRIGLKLLFIVVIIILPFIESKKEYDRWNEADTKVTTPIRIGHYDVIKFAINKDTIAQNVTDTIRWENMIFDFNGQGSLISTDTIFRKRYGRAYFSYTMDSVKQELLFKKFHNDSLPQFALHYTFLDSITLLLKGKIRNDSVFIHLRKNSKQYKLAEKQFHWVTEYIR